MLPVKRPQATPRGPNALVRYIPTVAVDKRTIKLILKLSPNKSMKGAIKWGLIAGTIYIFVWWLNNAGMWSYPIINKGTEYLTVYPENLLSFVYTVFGLLALGLYATYFAMKSKGTETLEMLKLPISWHCRHL